MKCESSKSYLAGVGKKGGVPGSNATQAGGIDLLVLKRLFPSNYCGLFLGKKEKEEVVRGLGGNKYVCILQGWIERFCIMRERHERLSPVAYDKVFPNSPPFVR
jgi:hypothetical protein